MCVNCETIEKQSWSIISMIQNLCKCGAELPCAKHSRPPNIKRGYDHRWNKFRNAQIHKPEYAVCADPFRMHVNQVRPTRTLDHIIPVTGPDDSSFWIGPFQGLCKECDIEKTRRDRVAGMTRNS